MLLVKDSIPQEELQAGAEYFSIELEKCAHETAGAAYFIHNFATVQDIISRTWIPFKLWPAQFQALKLIQSSKRVVILKARQIGLTWLVIVYALWLMIFRPEATILLFSRRDDESKDLIKRMKGVYKRLPEFMKCKIIVDNEKSFELENGSRALAFPTTGGDSYTATLVIVDEADLIKNLEELLLSVEPTMGDGGQIILLSRPEKTRPDSYFKEIFRAAQAGLNNWAWLFLPWWARPTRTLAWFRDIVQSIIANSGSEDGVFETYPATAEQALAARSRDKFFSYSYLEDCFQEITPFTEKERIAIGAPGWKELRLFARVQPTYTYIVTTDNALGNANSNDSAIQVICLDTMEQVAAMNGKFIPALTGFYADELATYFNHAIICPENNAMGAAVLLWIQDNSSNPLARGWDGNDGWTTNTKGKYIMYSKAAEKVIEGNLIIHDLQTFRQLVSITGSGLSAPDEGPDDLADSYVIAVAMAGIPRINAGNLNRPPKQEGKRPDMMSKEEIAALINRRIKKKRSN